MDTNHETESLVRMHDGIIDQYGLAAVVRALALACERRGKDRMPDRVASARWYAAAVVLAKAAGSPEVCEPRRGE